jgi:hypothetical protein
MKKRYYYYKKISNLVASRKCYVSAIGEDNVSELKSVCCACGESLGFCVSDNTEEVHVYCEACYNRASDFERM